MKDFGLNNWVIASLLLTFLSCHLSSPIANSFALVVSHHGRSSLSGCFAQKYRRHFFVSGHMA
jgi:hypothetical protein